MCLEHVIVQIGITVGQDNNFGLVFSIWLEPLPWMCLKTGHTKSWKSNFYIQLTLLVMQRHPEVRHASPQISWQKGYLRHWFSLFLYGQEIVLHPFRNYRNQAVVDPLCLVRHMLHWYQAQCYPNSALVICTGVFVMAQIGWQHQHIYFIAEYLDDILARKGIFKCTEDHDDICLLSLRTKSTIFK